MYMVKRNGNYGPLFACFVRAAASLMIVFWSHTVAAQVLIEEVATHVGFSASYNSDRSMLIDFRCDGAWLSSIIEEFSEKNVALAGLENLPHNDDNSQKSYKLMIANLPKDANVVRKEVVSLISGKFNLKLSYKDESVTGFIFDFKSHTIPLKKTEKEIAEVWGIRKDRFVGYSFDNFRNVLRSNIKRPFEFRNAPKGFYTFSLDGKAADLPSVLSWAKRHNVAIANTSSTSRFLVIEKQRLHE